MATPGKGKLPDCTRPDTAHGGLDCGVDCACWGAT